MAMKVLLVSPSQSQVYGIMKPPDYPSLGLAYLGAVLDEAGHNVKIIDIDAEQLSNNEFLVEVKNGDYGLVGITVTTPTFSKALELTEIVKNNSDAYTVLGGIHANTMPEECINNQSVDFIVKGEGEITLLELVRCLETHGSLEHVDGLYYKENGKILRSKNRALIGNLDTLPFPSRRLSNRYHYSFPDALYELAFPVMTSRGCPGNCIHCNSRSIFSRRFRARSPKNVVDEIEYLIREYKAKEIHIWDDNFTTQKKRVFEIRDEIKRRNIDVKFSFPNGVRVDYVDEEVLQALKDMGAYSVAFGVESGNQRILNHINKNITLERIEKAFYSAKKAGLETWGFFMIGLPSETRATINDTINFSIRIKPDIAKFHILKPFPGTDAYRQLQNDRLIMDNNFDHYGIHTAPVHRLPTLDSSDLLTLQKEAYRRFYLRPSVLLRQILRLKSMYRLKHNATTAFGVFRKMFS